MGLFTGHAVLVYLKRETEHFWPIALLYTGAISFTILFSLKPELFLLPSSPKMYFPNYYEPGPLNWVRLFFLFGLCLPYQVIILFKSYLSIGDKNSPEKKKLSLFILAILIGFGIGFIPNFLVYDIKIDPALGTLGMFLFTIPFVYGSVNYGLLDIKINARQAFWYALAIGGAGALIMLFNFFDSLVRTNVPSSPKWVAPLVSGIFIVTIAALVGKKLKEEYLIKDKFIATITHKFRAPLTHIRIAAENLSKQNLSEEGKNDLAEIKKADLKLAGMIDLIVNVSENSQENYFARESVRLSEIVYKIIAECEQTAREKNIRIEKNIESGIDLHANKMEISFAIQTVVENAIVYSKPNQSIEITLRKIPSGKIEFSAKDSGLGVTNMEKSLVFKKFYRSERARLLNTEGIGVNLFMTKKIIEGAGGKVWVDSAGENKGSIFYFSLPKTKKPV